MKKFFGLFITLLALSLSVNADDFRFAQMSDVKYNASGNNEILKKAILDINKQKNIKFVVFTGDNINKPEKNDLDGFLKEAKKLNCPFYIVLGDKDVNKHKELSKKQYFKEIKHQLRKFKYETPNYVFEYDDTIFMVVDGSKEVIPSTNGFYKEEVLTWLNKELDLHTKKNVIIFQHFPLIPPADKESYYTYKPENYLTILHNHKNVKAVISGHFGINKEQHYDGIAHISTAGLPYYRIIDIMDAETQNPTIWAELKEIK